MNPVTISCQLTPTVHACMQTQCMEVACICMHACTVGVSWQLIVTECSQAVTKITVHHKACALSREALWYVVMLNMLTLFGFELLHRPFVY